MTETTRVLIVDDHTMVRHSLALFLQVQQGIELVGQASNGLEAVELCRQLVPDIVLMDMQMPQMDGIQASRLILEKQPCIRIIALSSYKEEDVVRSALNAGVMSYVLKNASLDELLDAIDDAMLGRSILSPEATQALISASRNPSPSREQLSQRELEILKLMTEGMTNRQISFETDLSLATVKFHVSSILSKLNAASRTEAVALAMQHRLVA